MQNFLRGKGKKTQFLALRGEKLDGFLVIPQKNEVKMGSFTGFYEFSTFKNVNNVEN